MELLSNLGLFIVSLAVLLKASDWLIDSAEKIGLSLKISPFVIGLTIVAFGTSLPELATSIASVLAGTSEIVVGNVVGSNITNIALVLGLSALISGNMNLSYNIWRIDMPFLLGSSFLLLLVLVDGEFSLFEGIVMLLGIVIFLTYNFLDPDPDITPTQDHEEVVVVRAGWQPYVLVLVSAVLVWLSAKYTIESISVLSALAGIPPAIIAISAVAFGTSLPEVIVSINAARRSKTSIAIGNVLGSNIFNTFVVMGIPRLFGETLVPADIKDFYLPLMLIMTVMFGLTTIGKSISRWEGALFLLFYLLFFGHVIHSAGY